MAEAQKRSADRNIVHCLQCHKPQENLPVHLARVCMKKSTPEERADEVQKARASSREWIRNNRTWDHNQLCELLPDRRSRVSMVKELLRRGFFITNQPQESEGDSATATRSAPSSPQEPHSLSSSSPADQDDVRTDPSWRTDPSTSSSSVRLNMKKVGLYDKFSAQTKLLLDFKKYLLESERDSNCQQEVNNVSRFLRYLQPTGVEPTLDFLSKSTETRDYLSGLQNTGLRLATVLNYIKSMVKFCEYLMARPGIQQSDPQLRASCQSYTDMLKTLRKTVSKTHADKTCSTRLCVDGAPGIADCQAILRAAKPDFLRIRGNLLKGSEVSHAENTLYRYYCEALLVFRHMQRPGAVQGLTDAEWVDRIAQSGRAVIGVRKDKTSSMQVALTQEEEACFQLYYQQVRPENIQPEKLSQSFFISSSGEAVRSVTQDMNRLHEFYKRAPLGCQDVRRAVGKAARKLPARQQEAVNRYLALSAGAAQQQDRTPRDIVDAAVLLDSLDSPSSDDDTSAELSTAGTSSQKKDFSAFVTRFPVSLEGQPPTKKQRISSGFPEDRVFYDRWRSSQYTQREEYLLSHFTLRKPSVATVARLIAKEGWKANYPKPEEIEHLWKPAPKRAIETDSFIIKCVSQQTWAGLAIKDFGAEQGLGVVATRPFSKGDIVCDYHGKVITGAAGRAMMKDIDDEAGYMFFFKAGQRDLCIEAQTFPCECHLNTDTIGRRINHSSKRPNLKPFHCVLKVDGEDRDVVLFMALQDISVDTQLKFDYGVKRTSFCGEGQDLNWLDE